MLKMGVMGCAAIARRRVIPAMQRSGEVELVAVASRSTQRAEEFAKEFGCEAVAGYDALLARGDLEAVYIPLPTGLHEEWVGKALEAGLHVLVEKSFTDRVDVARRLAARAQERGRLLMENLMFQYHSQLGRLRELLDDGAIGELRTLRSAFGYPPLPNGNFRWDAALGGGALIDSGTYTIRVARVFLEDRDAMMQGEGLRPLGASLYYDPEHRVDVYGSLLLESRAGITAQCAFGMDYFYQCSVELWGSQGKLVADRIFTAHPDVSPRLSLYRDQGEEHFELAPDDHFANLLREFARAVRAGDHAWHRCDVIEQARLLDEVRSMAGGPS